MTIPILATVIRLLWILFEYPYLRRNSIKAARDWDRHSAKLWDAANLIEPIGMLLGFTSVGSELRGLWRDLFPLTPTLSLRERENRPPPGYEFVCLISIGGCINAPSP